jgi:CMP/dCMP kinase
MQTCPVVTIDGPSGCGKGTISQLVASALNWHLLDSGAMYRILALAAQRRKLAWDDADALVELAQKLNIRFNCETVPQQVLLDEEDVSQAIRNPHCSQLASQMSTLSAVRNALTAAMRAYRQPPGLVADGRDMGTVVFADANLKFYLDADRHVRAQRRYLQLQAQGNDVNLAAVLAELSERDQRDMMRQAAPLRPADDAIIVDTSALTIDAVFELLHTTIVAQLGL